jgi:predicted DNA-binding protein YlxM (UPF0122 family)
MLGDKMEKEKPDKKELNKLFHYKNLSTIKIARIYQVSPTTISKWMINYGISRFRKLPTEEELVNLYIKDKLNSNEIGRKYNLSGESILRLLKKYKIPIRNNINIEKELESLLEEYVGN